MPADAGWLYLDANVLVALHVDEAGSAQAERLAYGLGMRIVTSDFALAETSAAIWRKVRADHLSVDEAQAAFNAIDRWLARDVETIQVGPVDMRRANTLVRDLHLNLRAPDAIHVAVSERLSLTLATFDVGLANAARVVGIKVAGA